MKDRGQGGRIVWRYIAPLLFAMSCILFSIAHRSPEMFTTWNFTLTLLIFLSLVGCIINTVNLVYRVGQPKVLLPLLLNFAVVFFMAVRVILDSVRR
jgi:hypothetical protein